jgi:hypothetical protein
MSGRTLRKWDAEIARQSIANCTGKDRQQAKVLDLVKGVYRATSMVRRVSHIQNLPEKIREFRIAELKLTEEAFLKLHQFCKTIADASWRSLTPHEEAIHFACKEFQAMKRSRKAGDWVEAISLLPKEEQAHTACVVWWDIFADRECTNRFKPFDKWLAGFRNSNFIANSALRRNLLAVGYPEPLAERRVLGEDLEETEETETV